MKEQINLHEKKTILPGAFNQRLNKKTMAKTIFNPENKDSLTYGECLEPAMKITDPEDAKQYLKSYVKWQSEHMGEGKQDHTPEEICKTNISYYAGYFGDETRKRMERLFNCAHPLFGKITQ